MKRVLILDDDWERHHLFIQAFKGEVVCCCVSRFLDFVRELHNGIWGLIHLDHDLGDKNSADSFVNGFGETVEFNGVHAVNHILRLNVLPKEVIVHSHNNAAAPRMVADLRKAGIEACWLPFGEVSL